MAPISLSDSFSGGSFGAQWETFGTAVIESGRAKLTMTSGWSGINSAANYDFSDSHVTARVWAPTQPGNNSRQMWFEMAIDSNNSLMMGQLDSGEIQCRVRVGGVNTTVASGYYPTGGEYWRIQEYNGDVWFGISTDGVTWDQLHHMAHGLTTTSMYFQASTGYWGTESTDYLYLDDVNILPATPKFESWTEDFGRGLAKWNDNGTAISVVSGQLVIPIGTSWKAVWTPPLAWEHGSLDITDSSVFAKVTVPNQIPASSTGELWFNVFNCNYNSRLSIFMNDNRLRPYIVKNGSMVYGPSGPTYNASTMAYWRIREASGTAYFDYSADGATWTNFDSYVHTLGEELTEVGVELGGVVDSGTDTLYLDKLNIPPSNYDIDLYPGASFNVVLSQAAVPIESVTTATASITANASIPVNATASLQTSTASLTATVGVTRNTTSSATTTAALTASATVAKETDANTPFAIPSVLQVEAEARNASAVSYTGPGLVAFGYDDWARYDVNVSGATEAVVRARYAYGGAGYIYIGDDDNPIDATNWGSAYVTSDAYAEYTFTPDEAADLSDLSPLGSFYLFNVAEYTTYIEVDWVKFTLATPTANITANLTASGTVVDTATASPLTATATLTASGVVVDSSTATLTSGTAALTAAGVVVDSATLNPLTGTAALTTAGVVVDSGAVTLPSGIAALYAAGYVVSGRTVAVSATGSLTSAGVVLDSATVALPTGVGSLSASGTVGWYATSTSTTTGSLSASATPSRFAAVAVSATGSLTSTALVTDEGTGLLTGAGSLSAVAGVSSTRTVAVSGTGSLTTTAVRVAEGSVALTASGALSGAQTLTAATTVSITGAASLTSAAVPARLGASSLSATGTITTAGWNDAQASAALSATATVITAGLVIDDGTAVLPNGVGALTTAGHVASSRTVSVSATSALTTSGGISLAGTSQTTTASASLTSTGLVVDTATATLTAGVGALLATGSINTSTGATLTAVSGTLASTALVTDEGTGILAAVAALTTTEIVTLSGGSISVSATGALTSAAVRVPVGGVSLSETASLTTTGARDLFTTVTITGSATLGGTPLRVVLGQTMFDAVGALTLTATPERNAVTTATATAQMGAESSKTAMATGALSATATVVSASVITDEGGVALGVAGTLTSSALVQRNGAASHTTLALLTTAGDVDLGQNGFDSLATASLTAAGLVTDEEFAQAATATASLQADGYQNLYATGALAPAHANLTANGLVTDEATALVYSNATLVATSGIADASGVWLPEGTGHLTAIGYVSLGATTVTLSANGSLNVAGTVVDYGGAFFYGNATLTAAATQVQVVQAALGAVASLPVVGAIDTSVYAALAAAGSLTVVGGIGLYSGTTTFAITTSIVAEATVVDEGQQAVTGIASLDADGYVVRVHTVEMEADGTLTVSATVARPIFIWDGQRYVVVHQLWVRSVGGWRQPATVWTKTATGWRKVYS